MKVLLLFMFVAVAVIAEVQNPEKMLHQFAISIARSFDIPMEDVLKCIHKSGMTIEDMQYLEKSMDENDVHIANKERVRRPSCALVCCAQKKGIMIGGEVQLEEVYDYFKSVGVPDDVDGKLRVYFRTCKARVAVENITDECMAGFKFIKCMYTMTKTMFEGK